MKRSGHIFALRFQAIKRSRGIGSCLGDDVDLIVFQRFPNDVRYPQITRISGADNQNFRSGSQNIIDIAGSRPVSLLSPPVSDHFAAISSLFTDIT